MLIGIFLLMTAHLTFQLSALTEYLVGRHYLVTTPFPLFFENNFKISLSILDLINIDI